MALVCVEGIEGLEGVEDSGFMPYLSPCYTLLPSFLHEKSQHKGNLE